MSAEEFNLVIQLITGPASAVGICLLAGYAAWKLFVEKIMPQSDARFERIMTEHGEDRKAFREAIGVIDKRLEKVEDDITDIKVKLKV